MPIDSGQNLLHYTLVDKIGEGGMGAVWRATDTTLNREVAIKMLPQVFAEDADRLARFEREAQLLASLNHPNIAAVYGLHHADTPDGPLRFLAMELVEGEDLSKRLQRGPLSVERTLEIGAQMAAGIEAAHEKGVVHRDLKPANVIVAPDGRVRILDFGLAKAFEADPASSDPSLSPTMTSAGTVAGMILGTAAYMSPEQARGKTLDRRTDLWSFGCVLYECLTAKCLFGGETVSDSLAAVLRKDPDFSRLPDDTPPMVRLLLRRCLTRDPVKRLRDAGDARLELEQAIEDPGIEALGLVASTAAPVAQPAAPVRWLPWAVAALALVALAFVFFRGGAPSLGDTHPQHLTIPITGSTQFGENESTPPTVSPNGRWVVYGMTDDKGVDQLWLRPMDSFEARPLEGTKDAQYAFWSPDSAHIGFFLGGRVKRIEVATGRLQSVGGDGAAFARGASWSPADQILFVPNSNTGVWIVDAAGGTPRQITTLDPDIPDASHRWPHALPDGEHFLFLLWTNDVEALEQHGGVYLASISGDTDPVRLLPDTSSVAYSASGHLLLMQEDNLVAIPFDAQKLEVRGEGSLVTDGVLVNRNNGLASFSVSSEGTLVFARDVETMPNATFVWSDRRGETTETPVEPEKMFEYLRLSPDGARAVTLMPGATGDPEIWVVDLVRGVRTRLTPPAVWTYAAPIWSPDGDRILYTSAQNGTWEIYARNIDGSGEEQTFLASSLDKVATDWIGGRVLYWEINIEDGSLRTQVHDLTTQESTILLETPDATGPRLSPDGRFVTYFLNESGRREIFIHEIEDGARWQVSTAGGDSPHWSDNGREIVYLDPERRLMAVSVEVGSAGVTLGRPVELFQLDRSVVALDATGDHQRFLLAMRPERASEPVHVILNWN